MIRFREGGQNKQLQVLTPKTMKEIEVRYFPLLADKAGADCETIQTTADSPAELYGELLDEHDLELGTSGVRVSVNGTVTTWNSSLNDRDRIEYVRQIAGG